MRLPETKNLEIVLNMSGNFPESVLAIFGKQLPRKAPDMFLNISRTCFPNSSGFPRGFTCFFPGNVLGTSRKIRKLYPCTKTLNSKHKNMKNTAHIENMKEKNE